MENPKDIIKEPYVFEFLGIKEEKELDGIIKKSDEKIKDKIKNINTKEIIENSGKQKEINKMLENIEENYNIKIGEYVKEFYKQGFIDGINLMLNCLK